MAFWIIPISLLASAVSNVSTAEEKRLDYLTNGKTLSNNTGLTENMILTTILTRMQYLEDKVQKQETEIALLKQHNAGDRANGERECKDTCKLKEHYADTVVVVTQLEGIKTELLVDSSSHKTKKSNVIDNVIANTTSAKGTKNGRRKRQQESGYNVSFFAKIVQNVHHLGQNQNVLFETVVTNNGNAYNPYIGAFIAPVGGTYMFSTTLVTFNTDTSHYGIFVNDERITILYVNGMENTSDSTSQTVVLQLNEQDTVSVHHLDSDKSLVGYHHSLFCGFLIAQDYSGVSAVVGK